MSVQPGGPPTQGPDFDETKAGLVAGVSQLARVISIHPKGHDEGRANPLDDMHLTEELCTSLRPVFDSLGYRLSDETELPDQVTGEKSKKASRIDSGDLVYYLLYIPGHVLRNDNRENLRLFRELSYFLPDGSRVRIYSDVSTTPGELFDRQARFWQSRDKLDITFVNQDYVEKLLGDPNVTADVWVLRLDVRMPRTATAGGAPPPGGPPTHEELAWVERQVVEIVTSIGRDHEQVYSIFTGLQLKSETSPEWRRDLRQDAGLLIARAHGFGAYPAGHVWEGDTALGRVLVWVYRNSGGEARSAARDLITRRALLGGSSVASLNDLD